MDKARERTSDKGGKHDKVRIRMKDAAEEGGRDGKRKREPLGDGDDLRDDKERPESRGREEREAEPERERAPGGRERERGGRDRDREERERRERDQKREREKEKERERERERAREEKERERQRRKDKERKQRERERASKRVKGGEAEDGDDEDVERERKRQRKEDGGGERDKERTGRERDKDKDRERAPRKTAEELAAEEQQKLGDEMEKRRRKVREWQEAKRRKEAEEAAQAAGTSAAQASSAVDGEDEGAAAKKWTLDEEESDEEDEAKASDVDKDHPLEANGSLHEKAPSAAAVKEEVDATPMEEDDLDPLDAFMNSMVLPQVKDLEDAAASDAASERGPGDAKATVGTGPPMRKPKEDSPERAPPLPAKGKRGPKAHLVNGKPGGFVMHMKGGPKARLPPRAPVAKLAPVGRIMPGEDSESDRERGGDGQEDDSDDEDAAPEKEEEDSEFLKRVAGRTKADKLPAVDHSKINYEPFRKNFYIEVKEMTRWPQVEVDAYRKGLELKIHGKEVPKPIKTWPQTGLSSKILDVLKKAGFEKPMSIQAQAIPVIMSGRDCIGIAKTGSGKTLAFVLPMLRHIMDQPTIIQGDGPVAMIMAPTRELVQQIYNDVKKFAKHLNLACVPVYGGSGVAQQISDLKRGAEIVVCTPGRMIDILCTSNGKITNLRRVTYLVMDEADRMFDLGFEPQITRIVQNTRPDRQTVLFSATFPRQVEILARKVLNKPVEIQIGGRSVANKDIVQTVEIRPSDGDARFLRLLELLGEWYEKGKILVFVQSQDKCDSLFRDLLKAGYPCLSLHGAKDQTDRESTISDFKANVCNLLIATSIAARGLDVKELELVVNYDVPNHYEDYVHRVGRTGRAGKKGVAVTFIAPDEEKFAPDLLRALELSGQPIPEDLKAMADTFMEKVKGGTEQMHSSGYGGSGFKFNEEEEDARKAQKKAQAKEYGYEEEEDKSDEESDNEGIRKVAGTGEYAVANAEAQVAALTAAAKAAVLANAQNQPAGSGVPPLQLSNFAATAASANPQLQAALQMAQLAHTSAPAGSPVGILGQVPGLSQAPAGTAWPMAPMGLPAGSPAINPAEGAARAAALAAALSLKHNLSKFAQESVPEHYEAELEINDFPQHARWKVTHKDALGQISDWTGAAITTRGVYVPQGKQPAPGEKRLYLFIEGPTEASVKKAKVEVKRLLEETSSVGYGPAPSAPGKYSVL
eukprot:SM000008S22362  [mRNA]  locus=s8:1237126:1241861:- [translate_table: standard]